WNDPAGRRRQDRQFHAVPIHNGDSVRGAIGMAMVTRLSPADAIAEIRASTPGLGIGAFFDLDGTLVDGFTAAVHVGDRIRRRQAGIGELLGVFEAALRYRFG